MLKVLFMGTPDFAAECLKAIVENGWNAVGAVTQPDRPSGRGYRLIPCAVKKYAEENKIPVFQPETLRDGAFEKTLEELAPDVIVVAAYGKILPSYIINYPKYGCINAHGSLLPKYRGAAPIQRAIMDGERETGITVMYMDEGLDTGDMILTERTLITEEDDFETLHDRLAGIAGGALCRALSLLEKGEAQRVPQDSSLATYAAKIGKEDCILDFSLDRDSLLNIIRGLSPFPLAQTRTPDARLLKIISAKAAAGSSEAAHGTVCALQPDGFDVVCGGGKKMRITAVLPEGKGRMSAADFVRGRRLEAGDILKWQK